MVAGAAALVHKRFRDAGVTPAPTLIKAALIATADTLGDVAGNDHRPSNDSGWGRVNLNRFTDTTVRFYSNESIGVTVTTGQERTWTVRVGEADKPIFLVLVWNDPFSPTMITAPLINQLSLRLRRDSNGWEWRGNNFNENLTGVDNGYSYQFTSSSIPTPVQDYMNTVSAIFIPAGTLTAGQVLTLKVVGFSVPQGPQRFSLYAYNLQQ